MFWGSKCASFGPPKEVWSNGGLVTILPILPGVNAMEEEQRKQQENAFQAQVEAEARLQAQAQQAASQRLMEAQQSYAKAAGRYSQEEAGRMKSVSG